MNFKCFYEKVFSLIFFSICISTSLAQTTVNGVVTDAENKQPLPFVTISFTGTNIGATTDSAGKFTISSVKLYKQLKVSVLGYKSAFLSIVPGREQFIKVKLYPLARQLNEVLIKAGKKMRYRNKDNPAVELIRKVIENKEKNSPQNYDYVEYREYDKMEVSLSNLPDKISESKFFRKYKFILDSRDSTTVPGKSLLPIFLDEKLSQYYYRKNPKGEKKVTLGEKVVNLSDAVDNEGGVIF